MCSPSSAPRRTASWLAPRATKRSCHAAACRSWRREIRPRSRKEPASARAEDRRKSVRSRSKKAAAGNPPSGREARAGHRRIAPRVVLHPDDLPVSHLDDLEQPRNEALGPEPLEPLALELYHHTVTELDRLTRPQLVR